MAHASSFAAAGGGCWQACRKCGGVVGAGVAMAVAPVVGKVSAALVGTLGMMFSMPSLLGVANVRSMLGGCPAMGKAERNKKPGTPRERKSTGCAKVRGWVSIL